MKSELCADAGCPREFPTDGLPEVAVLGRSNVGKSSFINAVAGRRRLARISSTPGKTRRIHFYRLGDAVYLVDLPGFGYAAVGKAERRSWRPLVESYLRGGRAQLRGALLLIDARRGPEDEERRLVEWLAAEGIPARVALTKSDKLRRGAADRQHREVQGRLGLAPEDVARFSSRSGHGLVAVDAWIRDWTGFAPRRAR